MRKRKKALLDHRNDKSTTRQLLGFISFLHPAPNQGCHPPSTLSRPPLKDVVMGIHGKPDKSLQKCSWATTENTVWAGQCHYPHTKTHQCRLSCCHDIFGLSGMCHHIASLHLMHIYERKYTSTLHFHLNNLQSINCCQKQKSIFSVHVEGNVQKRLIIPGERVAECF